MNYFRYNYISVQSCVYVPDTADDIYEELVRIKGDRSF